MANVINMEGTTGFTSVNAALPATSIAPPSSAGTKRKRESKGALKFYAVRVGKEPGIYHSWSECLDQVRGYPKATFKSFTSLTEAHNYIRGDGFGGGEGKNNGKWYGVKCGRTPGVYNTWHEVLDQVTGWKGPKHKAFKTRTEAETYVAEGARQQSLPNGDGHTALESVEIADGTAPTTKKAKTSRGKNAGILRKENVSPDELTNTREYEPGEAPLPEDAEDGFDTSITLDLSGGTARYKTAAELNKMRYQAVGPAPLAPIRIYTDGSSLSNGTAASIGGVGVYFGPGDKRNISEALPGTKQTNQRAELTAILRALEVAPKDRRITVYTDSNYAIRCCNEWFLNWRQNGWINAARKPVENKDLINKIVEALDERLRMNEHRDWDEKREITVLIQRGNAHVEKGKLGYERGPWEKGPGGVEFVWVKGHAADEGNNAADSLATAAAREARELMSEVKFD